MYQGEQFFLGRHENGYGTSETNQCVDSLITAALFSDIRHPKTEGL